MARPKLSDRTLIAIVAAEAVTLGIAMHESRRQRLRFLGGLVARYAE